MGKKKHVKAEKNPFNLKVNRQKHSVLGQKVRGIRGTPAISHGLARARKKTLLDEKKLQQKANHFLDHRLVGGLATEEEQATLRLVRERQKKIKKNIFNLNEEENLTHKGEILDFIQELEKDASGSEDEEPLDAKFVSQAHFGGFSAEHPLTQKEIVAQLILDSKQKKQEKKVERQINIDLTEKLDAEWKQLHTTLSGMKSRKQTELPEKNHPYDVVVQELKFGLRGAPTERLRSSEEIIREEQKKFKKLEAERLLRMIDTQDAKNFHDCFSADSIYDGIHLEEVNFYDAERNSNSDCDTNVSVSEKADSESELAPFTEEKTGNSIINLPVRKEDFLTLIQNTGAGDALKTVEAILSSNHCNKWANNRHNIDLFFGILLEYIQTCCEKHDMDLNMVTALFPHLYSLAELSPVETAHQILKFLDKEQKLFQSSKKSHAKNSLRVMTLVILKLCSVLYSSSDFNHPVITPASIYMSDILASKFSDSLGNIVSKLFVSGLYLEWVSQSKRIVPEALQFLNRVLYLILQEKPLCNIRKNSHELNLLLFARSEDNFKTQKTALIPVVADQLFGYVELYSDVPSFYELFAKTRGLCQNISKNFHSSVIRLAEKLDEKKTLFRRHLLFPHVKPKPLKLFEPYFESKFTNKKENETKKRRLVKCVSQKIRKEEKCLLREVRRDTRLLASEKLYQQMEADKQRKQKVKQLYQELAVQEGEYKKIMKHKS